MLVTKSEVKHTSKKLLSVLLAVIMIMTSMSVCFGSLTYAAGGTPSTAQWNTLIAALKYDSVKDASFSGSTNAYTVDDPDGRILAAVEAYWSVFNTLADKAPSGSSAGNRTINQVNTTIKNQLSSKMGATDYANYNVANFITKLIAGANVTATGTQQSSSETTSSTGTPPGTNLAAVADVNLTVISSSAVTNYTIDTLPDSVVTEKTFTVSHKGDKYDYTNSTRTESGCNGNTTYYTHKYTYYNYISATSTKNGSAVDTAVIKASASTLNTYKDYFTADIATLVSKGSSTLSSVKTAVNNAKSNVVNAFSLSVYNHFFPTYNVDVFNTNIDNAQSVIAYTPIAREIKNLAATDYSAYNYSQLVTLYNNLSTKINSYNPTTVAANYIATTESFDLQAAKDELVAIDKEIKLIEIREAKAKADAHMAEYNAWTTEQIDEGTLTSAMIAAALSNIAADIAKLKTYNQSYVTEVCGSDYYTKLNSCDAYLDELATAAGYNDQFSARYAEFAAEIQTATDVTLDDDALLEGLQSYDDWYAELKALIGEMESVLGTELAEALFDDLDTPMKEHMDAAYLALNTRVETQINDAYALFTAYKAAHGKEVNFNTISEYNAMRVSIGLINVDAYDFLNVSKNMRISQDAINKYNALQEEFPEFDAFIESMGFSEFKTTEIEDIIREDTIKDIARENEDVDSDSVGEYVVDDAKVLDVIDKLDALLNNAEIQSLLGNLINKDEDGNPTGEPFDLGGMIKGLIKDALFTDSMINTIVGMLYPLVVTEFIKVWANDLPAKNGDYDIDYIKTLYTIFKEADFAAYPDLLADKLDSSKYAENIAILKKATSQFNSEFGGTGATYYTTKLDGDKLVADKTPWDSAVLKKNVIDEETGEVVYDGDEPKTEWALTWGVDDAKAKLEAGEMTEAEFDNFFYQAFDDAMEGLKPLLLALLANKEWNPSEVDHIADTQHKVLITLDVEVGLQLGATPNRGYANLLVPIYEVLGTTFTAPATVEGYANNTNAAADIFKAILDPIFSFADKLSANPLDTLLGILPDLCYALSTQMVTPLLDMLKTSITYQAIPYVIGGNINVSAFVDISGGADISVGSMLDLEELGVDLTDGLNTLLKGFGLDLPQIDQGKVATLGTLTTINTQRGECIYPAPAAGKAYHVEANKADVLLYLVEYILTSGLLDTLVAEPSEVIAEIFNNLANNPDDVIAAIAELLTMEEYDTLRKFEWFNGIINGENVLGNSATEIYLDPNNDWTEDKADYLYDNLENILNAIFTMAKLDLNKETEEIDGSVEEVLGSAIDGLLSDKTLTALARLLGTLDLNALLAGDTAEEGETSETETGTEGEETAEPEIDVNALVKNLLGIDLSVFAEKYADIPTAEEDPEYVHDFGVDSGEKTFAAALAEMLAPLNKVLDFILEGGNLEITLSEDEKVTLIGNDGYNSAIVPLLEALGCDVKALAESDDALTVVIETLVAKIETLTTNTEDDDKDGAIYGIIDMLPGVLYFIASKGLSTSVRNLLHPVYVLLDTIRPIYDVDLGELINGLLPEDFGSTLNLDDIGVEAVLDIIAGLVPELNLAGLEDVIYDVCDIVGTEYDSVSTFQTEWKKGAYILEAEEGEDTFTQADLLTVVLSFVLEWITVPENGEALDELLGTDGIVASIGTVFEDVEISYGTPNWMYWFNDDQEAFNEYIASGENLPNTLAALEYPNDWTTTAAEYFAEHLSDLVDEVVVLVTKDEEATVSNLLSDLLNGYMTTDTMNQLVDLIADLLKDIDDNLLEAAGYLLDVDIVGLKNYECTKEIKNIGDFADELASVLDTYAGGLVNWLFFGDDYRFAKKSDSTDTIVINGGLGYEKGLALVLEALGCELPAEATAANVLDALATRVEAIIADPVNEILDLLPNLIYFLNANGAGVAIDNLLQPVKALLKKLETFGLNINLDDLIKFTTTDENGNEKEVKLNLAELSLANVAELVETLTKLDLTVVEDILVNFCTGKISKGTYIYNMEAERKDVVTILLTVVLMFVEDEDNAKALDELLGTEIISALKTVFESVVINYVTPDWNYPLGDNGTVDAMKYSITYPNNWNEETAAYVTENLPEIGDMIAGLIDSNYATLSDLLKDKVNVFTSDNLKAIVDLVANLLGDIDDSILDAVGVLLNVDLAGLKNHDIPADINTVEAFAAELSTILSTYAPGVVEWLLLGNSYEFFVADEDGKGESLNGETIITIDGADGYANGLALLLEALGCENLPAADGETADIIEGVLTSLAARIQAILDNPVEEIMNLLPNLFYFLNTNGVAVAVINTTAALTALSTKLETFVDINLDVTEMVNLKELLNLPEEAKLSMTNLSMEAVLEAVGMLVGLDLTLVEDVLVDFALGELVPYTSVSGDPEAKKMVYADEFDKKDMVTVIANLVLITLADEANAEFVKELVGEEAYAAILNVLNIKEAELKKMSWQHTDKVGQSFNAMSSSENYSGYGYGPRYTEEMAQYIADNIGTFVDNIIYLLGIEIDGVSVDSLTDLLNGLVDGNLYNSSNVVAIRDALSGLLDGIANLEVNGANVGNYIVEVLKTSLGVDITAVAKVDVPEFTENKDMFVEYLCKVIDPLGPILNWILTDKDIAFFVKADITGENKDLIQLPGAEGYKNGIVLLLEALGCDNIVDPAALNTDASGTEIVKAIIDPLLNRVDEILANPAEELLAILPNLIYFINSNGVDVVVKNTLNAVYTVLNAIEPIAKIDLYELIGLDLETLTFEKLIDMLLKDLEIAGFKFTGIPMDTFVELTVGKLETYPSLSSENPAYRMVYDADSASTGDMVTVILRLVITFILTENNREVLIDLLKSELGMSADAEKYVAALLKALADCTIDNQLGMDSALATIYYVYYGADIAVGETADGKKELDKKWNERLKELGLSENREEATVGNLIADILDIVFNDQGDIPEDGGNDVLDQDGVASNGFLSFFERIKIFFQEIAAFFRELFSFGR